MYGIIYKFTIVAKYKFDGHRPFYVGQRWETKSIDKFLSRNCSNYPAFGKMWVTNGNDNLFIKTTDEIPQGYYKGLTRRKI